MLQCTFTDCHWLFSVQNCQMTNHFPKWLALLADHIRAIYVNSQNHREICYEMAVFQYYDVVVSIVAGANSGIEGGREGPKLN